jgi:hypothetical protein
VGTISDQPIKSYLYAVVPSITFKMYVHVSLFAESELEAKKWDQWTMEVDYDAASELCKTIRHTLENNGLPKHRYF